ncbi:MAG: hypothetical protein GEU99_18300 [Luteitalea sp.]|nr:hypothetical protein [Luteitalea sp.]
MKTGMAVVLCGVAVMAVLWAAAAPRAPYRVPAVVHPTPKTEAERMADEVGAQAERLRAYLRTAPGPRATTRNPFRFADPPRPRAPQGEITAAPPRAVRETAQPAVAPLRLIGVAERVTTDGVERTAIISGEGQLFMVTAGDRVAAHYVVTAVGADAVELRDTETAAVRRLGLP